MTTISNETTLTTRASNRQVGLFGLDIVLAVLLAVTMFSLPFPIPGHAIHCVGGFILMAGCGVHLMMHTRWMKAAIWGTPANITPVLHRQRRMFWGMFVSGSVCGLSGLISLPSILAPHAFLPLHCCGTPIHILSGFVFIGFNIYHLVLHRNWFAAQIGRRAA